MEPSESVSTGGEQGGADQGGNDQGAASVPDRIIDAAMTLAASQGWSRMALADVATAAGLSLLDVYRAMPSKLAILAAFSRRLDRAVLAGQEAEAGETPRDRLFDVLMRRFDAMQPHREGVRAIMRDLRRDPLTALAGGPHFMSGMVWMLEAAGLPVSGIRGGVRAHVLAGVYLAVLRTFLDDASPDLSPTMAALDQRLRRASGMLGLTPCRGPRFRRPAPDAAGNENDSEPSYSSAYKWDSVPDPEAPR